MSRYIQMLAAGMVLCQCLCSGRIFAADQSVKTTSSPNAAVIYWQAFAMMPTLEGDAKTKYEAAVKNQSGPIDSSISAIVSRFDAALRDLNRARSVSACDWNLDYDAGFETLLPHLSKARTLAQAGLLRARMRFGAGKVDDALSDVMSVMKLARDCSNSPLLISMLVDSSIEKMAADVLAANLAKLNSEQLASLSVSLKTLAATPSLADCIRFESSLYGDWLDKILNTEAKKVNDPKAGGQVFEALFKRLNPGGDQTPEAVQRRKLLEKATVADVRESVRLLRADYSELSRISGLPTAERIVALAAFRTVIDQASKSNKQEDALRVLSYISLPAISKIATSEEQLQVRRQLLFMAVELQRSGPDAIKDAKIPGHGPVEYRKTNDGVELVCKPLSADKPEVLRINNAR